MVFDLSKIGQSLKASREEKGYTLDDISKALFVRKSLIDAIESGNWDLLPHPVYVKGYITQYASFLHILDQIASQLAAANEDAVSHVEKEILAPRIDNKEASARWGSRSKVISGIGMGLVVVAFLIFQNTRTPITVAVTSSEAVSKSYQPVAAGSYETVAEKRVPDTKKLTIACEERTWVRVIIDETEKKEFTLNPEEVVMLNAKEKFDLLIGNAAGVKVFYDGKDTGFTGENGEVKRLTLS